MLKTLMLRAVGPAPEMTVELADRINVITGDNGAGKTLLLDVAWWALTRTWARTPPLPTDPARAAITSIIDGQPPATSHYQLDQQAWPVELARPSAAGLVVYMHMDDGISVWDSARNAADHFDRRAVSEGFERDRVSWQKERQPQYALLERVSRTLSPPDGPALGTVPPAAAPAAMGRVLALAYLLVRAWHEHRISAESGGTDTDPRLTLLIDEPEMHLHPVWQRRVIPAIVEAVQVLHEGHDSTAQIIIATHSPLVLASLEPLFDEERDALFRLRFEDGRAEVRVQPWAKQGDAAHWLVSGAFGLAQARSAEAEQAIEAAEAFLRGDDRLPEGLRLPAEIDARLRELLPAHDPFWGRWLTATDPALRVPAKVS